MITRKCEDFALGLSPFTGFSHAEQPTTSTTRNIRAAPHLSITPAQSNKDNYCTTSERHTA